MKCQIGEAIEKIDKLISNNSKVDDNTINQLIKVKKKLNSVKDIRMSRMQSNSPGSESKRPEFDKLPSYKEGQKNMVYAGIGSRETPLEIQQSMNDVAKELESIGYTLRSGNAIGADKAFEGAPQPWSKDSKGSVKQWSKYSHKVKNKEIFKAENATDKARKIAKEIHANPTALSGIGLDLMARNTNQIFGSKLDTPVDFVLAWTPLNEQGKPVTKHEDKSYDKDKKAKKARGEETFDTGGTGQAISYASLKGIPVINMADKNWREQLDKVLNKNKTEEAQKIETKPSEPDVVYGSVVKYKPENGIEGYYIVRGFSSNGGLQLTDAEGKNFSGTPKLDKVKFIKQLEIKRYNNVDYIIDSNNKVYTSNGEVTSKNYVDRLLNNFGISKENKQEDKQNETVYEIAERAIIDKINKLKNNHTFFGNEYDEYMINLEKFLDKLLTEGLKSSVTINYSKETAFKFMNTGVAGSFIPKNNLIVLPDFDSLLSDKDLMDKLIKPYTKNKDIDYEFISDFLNTKIGNIDNDHYLSSLIHERVHSVVSKWLFDENNEDHEYMYEINDLFNIAKNKFEKLTKHEQDKIGHYWKKDIHEFAAEGLASKSLVEFLRNIEIESSSNRSGVKTTLLDELFAIVSKIYKNITGKNLHNSLLTVIVKIAENENDIESFSKYQSNLAATEAYTSNASLVKIGSAREYGIYLRENYTDVYTHVGEVFDKYDQNKTITDRKQFGNHLYVSDLAWSSYWKAYRASVLDNKMEEWSKELGLDSLIDYNLIKEKHKSEYERLSKNTISYFVIKDENPIEIKSKKDLSSEELKDIYSKSPSSITEIGGINPYNDLIGGVKQKAILGDYVRLGSSEDIKNFKEFVKEYRDNDIVYLSDKSYNPQSEAYVDNNKYKTISKDDIEAAKDIMSNNKKECE